MIIFRILVEYLRTLHQTELLPPADAAAIPPPASMAMPPPPTLSAPPAADQKQEGDKTIGENTMTLESIAAA